MSLRMNVNGKLMNSLCDSVREIVRKAVEECAENYKFDSEEALSRLGLNEVVISLENPKKTVKKVVKAGFPLPFNGMKDDSCCGGLKQNHGLYTQCENKRGSKEYCKRCEKQALKNESGKPDYGRIEDRLAVGLMEYRDPKGKSPTPYTKIMKKMNISKEKVLDEAGKLNVVILEEHFNIEEEEKRGRPKALKEEKALKEDKKKGRPAKAKKVLEVQEETTDLFAEMIAAASSTKDDVNVNVNEEEKAEKEAYKAKKEQEKAEKKALKEAEKAKKEQEKALKETEKAKKEQEKAEKKALKEQEKQEKAVKKGEKKVKEAKPDEEEQQDVVKKFEYEGTKYLKSKKTGIVYNMEQDVVGKWDEVSKKIIFDEAESDSDEESEEEYDE